MSPSKHPDVVILGLHRDDTLNVFMRDEDGQIQETARIATHNGVTPDSMTAVMAGLADVFGWRDIAAAPVEVPQPAPPARVLPAPSREVRSAAADRTPPSLPEGALNGMHKNGTKLIYERIMRALDEVHPAGLRFGELHGVVGRGRSSGQVFGYLSVLVKRKLVRRPSEGLYVSIRQGAQPVVEADSHLSTHPAGTKRKGHGGGVPGSNTKHAVTIEQVIEFVAQHPEGVRAAVIADALMPGDKERGHTISNRLVAYENRVKRTGEERRMHKVVTMTQHGKRATIYPGPPTP